MHLLYIFGPPGSGKSSLTQALIEGHTPTEEKAARELWILRYGNTGVVELGREANEMGFRGTDRLGMAVQRYLIPWLAEARPRLVLAEGQRLARAKFFASCRGLGYSVTGVAVWVPAAVAAQRLADRHKRHGSDWKFSARKSGESDRPPKESWVQGARTATLNLITGWEGDVVKTYRGAEKLPLGGLLLVDGEAHPLRTLPILRKHPVGAALRL